MLTYISNEGKTYEERMNEAVTRIPLYTNDWTDFNPSDPGMTILEILSGFETLQQERLLEVPQKVKRNLLGLVGFQADRGRGARLLLSADKVTKPVTLPQNYRFMIGDISFETNRTVEIADRRVIGVYGKKADSDEFKNFDFIYDRETQIPASIFGENPQVGDALYIVTNDVTPPGKETQFYFTLQERFNRNPRTVRSVNSFATIRWECFCEDGWKEIDVRDGTDAFLMSGEVKMWLPEKAAECDETPVRGYCIRAVLERAEYDIRPKVISVEAFLFPVWQKKTLSEAISVSKAGDVEIISGIPEEMYINVFAREQKGESFRRYMYTDLPDLKGRYYNQIDEERGHFHILFDKEAHGFGPIKSRGCVRVVIYTDDVMRKFRIGRVLGYDNQRMELPYKRIVASLFCIIAERQDKDGEMIYDFVRPEKDGDGALYYHLLDNDGIIEIEDAGDFIGATLYIAAVSVHEGSDGNIRAGNELLPANGDRSNVYYNPGGGTKGAFRETLEDVRKRFVADMETAYTAVTMQDYERLVLSTPGLCIHKAVAHMDEMKNLVSIAVKPGTDDEFPRLPEIYQKQIMERLEERRLLTTRIELIQPVYTAVNVSGTVYVRLHYEDSLEQIEQTVREHVDYVNTSRKFGERLHFDEIFHAIEMLDCVEYVYDLSIRPQTMTAARMEDADIIPSWNCLLYAGAITIETIMFEM